ncbi:hypothetical protein V1L52_06990 [Treponema sp. HNW]|uniref:hypothetical protein n=1 Tax=Treponema sp. HNW TaxID=3116654 RepID=UPI003D1445B9
MEIAMKACHLKKYALRFLYSASALLYLTSCASFFQDKVPRINSNRINLSDIFHLEEEISILPKPKQIFVSQGDYADTITISWSSVKEAASYKLEYARILTENLAVTPLPEESDFEVLEEAVYGTQYTHKAVTNPVYLSEEYGYTYFYRVSAENKNKKYDPSPFTNPESGYLFAPPKNVKADLGQSTEHICITWEKSAGAFFYEIYRTQNANGTGSEYIGRISANENRFVNKISSKEQGQDFYFTVYAVNSSSERSVRSASAYGYALMAGAPSEAKNVTVTKGRGHSIDSIKLEWTASAAETEVKYAIYRSDSQDSALKMLKSDESTCTYTDTKGLKPGLYYYYYVQAWSLDSATGAKLKSPMSESGPEAQTPAEGFILSPPTVVEADKTDTTEIISWKPAIGNTEEQTSYRYKLLGSSSSDSGFNILYESPPPHNLTDGYLRHQLTQKASYYRIQTVRTIDGTEISSTQSITFAPSPFAAVNISATKYAKTEGPPNSLGIYPVKITWEKPANDEPYFYEIYRSANPDTGFRKITQTPLEASAREYLDENETAKAGFRYYYKVLTLNSLYQGKNFTSEAEGWGALTHEQYFKEYNKTVLSGQKRLTYMHKGGTAALGSETINGLISGTYSYDAAVAGLGARIKMKLTNFAEFNCANAQNKVYFKLTGDMNTSANMNANGTMDGTVICEGMYPGRISYDNIEIKGGAAGGGYYIVTPDGFDPGNVSYTAGIQ